MSSAASTFATATAAISSPWKIIWAMGTPSTAAASPTAKTRPCPSGSSSTGLAPSMGLALLKTCMRRFTRIWPFGRSTVASSKRPLERGQVPTHQRTIWSSPTDSGTKGVPSFSLTPCCCSHVRAYSRAPSASCGSTLGAPSRSVTRRRGKKWHNSAASSTPTRPAPTTTTPREPAMRSRSSRIPSRRVPSCRSSTSTASAPPPPALAAGVGRSAALRAAHWGQGASPGERGFQMPLLTPTATTQ
mmetsp:Transcript_41924/g.125365  ORF Transcript_41924/g.125365 Transcript_41924/m.125365 type:complete len:245 (-) Transcript_41924:488-1222(-)